MRKIFFVFITFTMFLISFTNIYALECKDIVKEAVEVYAYTVSNVTENGDVVVDLIIGDITENNYVVVENDFNSDVITYNYSDTIDGIVTIHSPNIYKKINYTIKVYLTDKTCNEDVVRTLNMTTSSYNIVSGYNVCGTEFYIDKCDPFYDTEGIDEDKLILEIEREVNELSKTTIQKVKEFIRNYYLFVIIPIVVITGIYIVRIIMLKRGRRR